MNVPLKLTAFAAVLALAFGVAALAGAAIDPTDSEPASSHGAAADEGAHGGEGTGGAHAKEGGAASDAASGLAVSSGGYTLTVDRRTFAAGEQAPLHFRIVGADGDVLRNGYELESEREMHVIVVRRDSAHYQHLHPTRDEAGTWSIDLRLPEPGVYRVYADFKTGGEQRTLASDLFVPGEFAPAPLPAPSARATVEGFDVDLNAPGLRAGRETELSFAVTRAGEPVARLQPYLGALGHLVALRDGDLAYLHAHPVEGERRPGEVPFAVTFPTPGAYRLFMQFKLGGEVHTVDYTLELPR